MSKHILRDTSDLPRIRKEFENGEHMIEVVVTQNLVYRGYAHTVMNHVELIYKEFSKEYRIRNYGINKADKTQLGYIFERVNDNG